jgi:hypothetical protein
VENREFTLQAFLDIERAFDSTLFDIITKAAKRYGLAEGPVCTSQVHWDHKGLNPVANQSINGLGDTVFWWIGCMLGGREITATLAGETMEGSVTRGCLQGVAFYHLCCAAWLWTNSGCLLNTWGMQMTLLSLSVENSQTPSQSFCRRL